MVGRSEHHVCACWQHDQRQRGLDLSKFIFYEGTGGSAYESSNSWGTSVGSGSTGGFYNTGTVISIDTDVAGFGPIGGSFGTYGGYPYQTLLHEIGHLIGLGHGGPYNGNVNAATQQFSAYDTRLWTIMSYINPWTSSAKYFSSYPVTGTNWGISADGYYNVPTTPMILDILAAQQLYGVATSGPLASGGQVFGFNSNIAGSIHQYFDFTVNTNPVITIWDGGLNNTLDLSGWNTPATINLNPGTFSSANGATNNIGIAAGTVIETAIGGGGNDTIIASAASSKLNGGAGNDTLTGNSGHDTLYGGTGIDAMAGGTGNDTYFVDNTSDVIIENANAGIDTVYISANYAMPANVEWLFITEGAGPQTGVGNALDNGIVGNSSNNALDGGPGNDTLIGNGGNDTLDGGTGIDGMIGGLGNDTYFVDHIGDVVVENPNEGIDTVYLSIDYAIPANLEWLYITEGAGALTGVGNSLDNGIVGNSSNNALDGGSGNDTLTGNGGNDTLWGGTGPDGMFGGIGNDTYFVDNVGDAVVENPNEGSDIAYAFINYTLTVNIENLTLMSGAGSINGTGNGQANNMIGNEGDNTLNGADGTDMLSGGTGNDTFVFNRGEGNGDTITDFNGNGAAAGDKLQFTGYGTAAQGATLTQVDATHWSINSSDGLAHDIITVSNSGSIHASDFVFV